MAQAQIPTTVRELEHAAQFLTANVNVAANDRQLAGEIFRLFKSSAQAFQLAKDALGATSNTYVIFQSIQALTAGILRDWSTFKHSNPQLIREVTDYYFHLMCSDARCSNVVFIQKQLCRSIAILCKKALVSLVGNQSQTGVGEHLVKRCLDQLKQQNDNSTVTEADRVDKTCKHAAILRCLLEEMQSVKNCRELACSVKSHLVAKKAFQRNVLPKLFEELLKLTHDCASPSTAGQRKILSALLDLLETSFSWDYRLSSSSPSSTPAVVTIAEESVLTDAESATSLRPVFAPPYEFGRLLFPPRKKDELLKFLFQLYLHVRNDAELAEKTAVIRRDCMEKFVEYFNIFRRSGSNDVKHLTNYIRCITAPEFSALLRQPNENEIDSIASIFSNLILYTSHSTYEKLENVDLEKFVRLFAEVTVTLGLRSLHEHEDADNVGMAMPFSKAYADLLTTWQSLLTMYNSGLFSISADVGDDMFGEHCFNMLQCFIHIHLSSPFGSRIDHEEHYVQEEINEAEEADAERFQEQLQVAGLWTRLCLDKALPFLDTLLQQVVLKFEQNFWLFIRQQAGGAENSTTASLYSMFEDVTWTMMIVSHVVFPAENDDVEEIPSGVVNYCEKVQHVGVSADATCQHLIAQLSAATHATVQDNVAGVDPFVRFVGRMFHFIARLVRQQEEIMTRGDTQLYRIIVDSLSPQIIKECLLFVSKWVRVYTLPSDVQIHMLSTTLNATLKTNEICVSAQLEFALQMSLFYLKHPGWSSEPAIAEQAALLVKAVCGKWTWGDKFNAQFFTESKAISELFYELSLNNDDGTNVVSANVLSLRLNKKSLITLYEALTVAVVSIANFEDNNNSAGDAGDSSANSSAVFSGWGGGGGMVSVASKANLSDGGEKVSQVKQHFTEKAKLMWQHLINSVTKRFDLALNGCRNGTLNRDMQWMLIIAALHSSVGIVRAQLQHGTVATCKIFGLAQYIRDSSHHCSAVFDLWCQQQLASTPTMSPHVVNEVLINFAPLLFEFYTIVSDELLTSGSTVVNDAALQNNICHDLHNLVEKWRFLVHATIVSGSSMTTISRQLEQDETQRAYQDSFCACCKSLESALSNLACLSIGVDFYSSSSGSDSNSEKDRSVAIDSLATHLVSSLTCILDVVTEQALLLPAVNLALFTVINRFLNALPKRTIFTFIAEQRFDRLMHALRHGIEIGAISAGGGVDGTLLQTYEALSNVALEIAYAIGTVRSACAPLSRGFADIKAATIQQFAAVAGPMMMTTGGNQMLDATMQLDAGQKRLLSNYMSNVLELILSQLFGGQLPSSEVSGAMANAVYSLICCCRMPTTSSVSVGSGGGDADENVSKSNYQNIFRQVLVRMVRDDEVVRNRLAEHCMALFKFIEEKAVIRDGRSVQHQQEQLRVEKKLKIEFRDEIFSPLFTDARMLISVNLLRGNNSGGSRL